jgi:hypothetical protein
MSIDYASMTTEQLEAINAKAAAERRANPVQWYIHGAIAMAVAPAGQKRPDSSPLTFLSHLARARPIGRPAGRSAPRRRPRGSPATAGPPRKHRVAPRRTLSLRPPARER